MKVIYIEDKLVNILERNEIICKEDEAVYRYGIDILLSNAFLITTIILTGILTKMFLQTSIFLLLFIGVRRFTGGYHATKSWRCFCVTNLLHFIVLALSRLSVKYDVMFMSVICSILVIVIIWLFAPVLGVNSIKDEIQIKKDQYTSRILSMIIIGVALVGLMISHYKTPYCAMIFTMAEIAILVLIRYLQKRRK